MNDQLTPDYGRAERIGIEEAIFCGAKTVEQMGFLLDDAARLGHALLLTRLSPEMLSGLSAAHRDAIDYEPLSRTGFFGEVPAPTKPARVAIVSAGTSDAGVALEVERTLGYAGHATAGFHDVGVAGLWRLMERIETIKSFAVVVVVAGMDAALVGVVGGLVPGAVIAVPTSVGYGAARGGETALAAALSSCAPGVAVVNIDNGYGAGCAALRILNHIPDDARAPKER